MAATIPEKFKDLFTKVAFAHLATSMADGSPQVTPVWVDYDGTAMRVALAPDGAPKPAPIITRNVSLPFTTGVVGFTAATANGWANRQSRFAELIVS